MREVEVVEHPQIDGLHLFFDTVQYRTPHIHRELEVIWLAEGALDVRIEQTQLRVQPGELVLFHPGQLHEFRAVGAGCTGCGLTRPARAGCCPPRGIRPWWISCLP